MQSFLTDKHVMSFCSFINDVSRSECVCVHGYGSIEVRVTCTEGYHKG